MLKIKIYLKEMRIKHYIKNLFVFFPLFFNKTLFEPYKLIIACMCFCSFCLLSSAIYFLNDLKDIDKDRLHPKKKNRPIAAGLITEKEAKLALLIFLIISLVLIISLKSIYCIVIWMIYLSINILYSCFGFKNIPIVDITIITLGFILRVLFGSVATDIVISNWLYLIIFSISLYIASNKRINEIKNVEKRESREVLKKYSENFLTQISNESILLTKIFYIFWVINSSNSKLFITIPFVILITMYYAYILDKTNIEDPVEVIFNNKFFLISVIVYILYMFYALYM